MKKWLGGILLSIAFIQPARADSLTISGANQTWDTSGPSPTFTVGISNPTASPVDLYAWQLGLMIAADPSNLNPGGTVTFASATIPTANYVLAGNSYGLLPNPITLGTDTIPFITDFSPTGTASTLPSNSSFNLLDLTFTASKGATGVFDVFALPLGDGGASGSGWTKLTTDFTTVGFDGFPQNGGNLLLGTLTLFQPQGGGGSIPEPSSIVMLIAGCAGVLVYRRVRRARAA
jgi:hypothetical protein